MSLAMMSWATCSAADVGDCSRPGTQRGGNRVRSARRKGRHPQRKKRRDVKGSAKGRAASQREGQQRKQGGGGLSHLGGGECASSGTPPGSTHTMLVRRKPQSAV
eukprot:scaffold109261_cov69-Phaeocystis_antarctica.AAC.1